MAKSLADLPTYDSDGALHVIVECPREARFKIDYDPKLRVFGIARPLALGVSFPFDFGFIPGTRAPDGDPVDALLLNDVPTYPGILVKCQAIGMVELTQVAEDGKGRETNNRLIVLPDWQKGTLTQAADLPKATRTQIEHFFLDATFMTAKRVRIEGWKSARRASAYIARHMR